MKLLVLSDHEFKVGELTALLQSFDTTHVIDLGAFVHQASLFEFHGLIVASRCEVRCRSWLRSVRRAGVQYPLIVVTNKLSTENRAQIYTGGADDCWDAPLSDEEASARVASLVRRSCGIGTDTVEFGDLTLSLTNRAAYVCGNLCSLSPREFAILRELLLARGRVVSRRALIDRAWGAGEFPTDGAVEFQVHGLRRRIGRDRIVTIRGLGYALRQLVAAGTAMAH
ncbi:MAG: hypothetical protein AMXMBFR59_18750 [Rhodanobacteraceae bacterium]